jgi:hypothetical protein
MCIMIGTMRRAVALDDIGIRTPPCANTGPAYMPFGAFQAEHFLYEPVIPDLLHRERGKWRQ